MFHESLIRPGDERGSALVAVIGVMAVGLIVTTLVMTSIVGGLSFTSSTRAGVQSQASAEAGIAVAQASLLAGTCTIQTGGSGAFSGTDPKFDVQVQYRNTMAGPWTTGCPPATVAQVRIRAAGDASAKGVLASGNDTSHVEGLYAAPPAEIVTGGAAIYAHSGSGFSANGTLHSVAGSIPNVHIKDGDVNCASNVSGIRDLIAANGILGVGDNCKVGNVWSSGHVTFTNNARVAGNVVSAGLTMPSNAHIAGDAWSTGPTAMTGNSIIAGRLIGTSLSMNSNSKVLGHAWLSSSPNSTVLSKIGGYSPAPGPSAPTFPMVPNWVDFDYSPADWAGFTEKVLTDCSFSELQAAVNLLAAGPGTIDARDCGGIQIVENEKLYLKNDLLILANKFVLRGNGSLVNSSMDTKLWLVTPDDVADVKPSCPAGGKFTMGDNFSVGNKVTALIYSPCDIEGTHNTNWRGQIYGGKVKITGNTILSFVPSGLPGVDLSTGTDHGVGGHLGRTLVSLRNIAPPGG